MSREKISESGLESSTRTNIQIKLGKKYYFQGEQVSGEVLLETPIALEGVKCIQLNAWAAENCNWIEMHDSKQKKGLKALLGTVKKTVYHGGTKIYSTTVSLYDFKDGNVAPGSYLIPFTFFLPFKVTASTNFKGREIRFTVRHILEAYLVPHVDIGQLKENWNHSTSPKVNGFDDLSFCVNQETGHHYGTICEFTVLEKPAFQASLRAYSWQCKYSIPHVLLGAGDLVMTIKRRFGPFMPGEEIPLWIEFRNQSPIIITDITVVLKHTVGVRSHSGTFKQIVYNHTQWRRPTALKGSKTMTNPTSLSFPLRLPEGLAATSHGSSVTSDWEVNVSCRYRGKWTYSYYSTDSEIAFPLTIWTPGTLFFDEAYLKAIAALQKEEEKKNQEGSKSPAEREDTALTETSLVSSGGAVTELPGVSFELSPDCGKPGATDIVRLQKKQLSENQPVPVISASDVVYKPSDSKCRLDLGASLSTGLEKRLLQQQQAPPARQPQSRSKAEAQAVRKKVAPLQK